LRVKLWGTRGSVPTPESATSRYGGNTPCIEITAIDDNRIILDAGIGLHWLGRELIEDGFGRGRGEAHLLLTHTHFAHIQGIPFFSPAMVPGNHFIVYGRGSGHDSLDDLLRKQMDNTYCPVPNFLGGGIGARMELREIDAGDFAIGSTQVSARLVNHVVNAHVFGLRLDSAGGSLAYLPDVEYLKKEDRDDALDLARGVDLLIHDAHFTGAEYGQMQGRGHCSADDAVALAIEAGAGRLLLFHHHPDRSDSDIDEMVASFADCGVSVEGACEGAVYELG
jgi:phosphoribosyl 1,2-cyclic phosphodiesterase